MKMGALAAAEVARGHRVLVMNLGEPAGGAPAGARRAGAEALTKHNLGYTVSAGMSTLRERIAEHYMDWYAVSVDPARCLLLLGHRRASPSRFSLRSTLATGLG